MVRKRRIFYLDFIRSISIIFIVIYHFNCSLIGHHISTHQILFKNYANGDLGQIGVSLFFIISGAALMYTYEENFSIKQFLNKRFLSIYPMFWTAYTIAFLYLFYINRAINPSLPKWTFILTIFGMDGYLLWGIPNFYILGEWFLGCIILLYFCFPLLRKFTIKNPKILMVCISLIYIMVVQSHLFKIKIDHNLLAILPEFVYAYAIFLCHHVIIERLLTRFNGNKITYIETYCLFAIACIFITIISAYLFKISNRLSKSLAKAHLSTVL